MQEQTQSTEPIVSQTSDIPVTPPKSNRSLVTGFVIVAILLVAGSVFAGIQIGRNQKIAIVPMAVVQSPEPRVPVSVTITTPRPTTDPTANWQSYSNSKYGFSFRYPEDYKVAVTPNKGDEFGIVVDKKTSTDESGFVPIQMMVNIAKDENGSPIALNSLSLAEAYFTKGLSANSLIREDIRLDGQPAVSVTGLAAGPGPGEGAFLSYTLVQLDGEVLIIQLGNKDYQNVFDQILATFKLTK